MGIAVSLPASWISNREECISCYGTLTPFPSALLWENAGDVAGPEEEERCLQSLEEELINKPRQRPVTPHLEGCAGTALPPLGNGPVSPDTLPLAREALPAPPGLPRDSLQPPPPPRVREKSHGVLGALGGSGINAAGTHLLPGDARGGSPVPGTGRSRGSPHASADTMPKFFVPWDAASGIGKGEKREHIGIPGLRAVRVT